MLFRRCFRPPLQAIVLFCLALIPGPVAASGQPQEVQIEYSGLTLNGNLVLGEGSTLEDGVVMIVHGTLAHNGMETVASLAEALNERGFNTLAITLSLGLTDRHGMYDCATPHRHAHLDALNEIGAWLDWLKDKSAGPVTLLAHSRGGNQISRFVAERGHPLVNNVVLLAPATWDAEKATVDYEKSHGAPLDEILGKAEAQVAAGHGAEIMSGAGILYCPGADVTADSFVSYYRPDSRFDTPSILKEIALPALVIAGSEDMVMRDLPEKVKPLADGNRLKFVEIDGADHFFRDLFAEDAADLIGDFLAAE